MKSKTNHEKRKTLAITLQSSDFIHTPGMIRNWRHMARTNEQDRLLAFLQMSFGFPTLPGLMVLDIIDGRLEGQTNLTEASVSFQWSGPLGKPEDYTAGFPSALVAAEDAKLTS